MICVSHERRHWAKTQGSNGLGQMWDFPPVNNVFLSFSRRSLGKNLVQPDEVSCSTDSLHSGSRCSMWQVIPWREQQLQITASWRRKSQQSRMASQRQNQNWSRKHRACRAVSVFLMEDTPNAGSHDHKCTIRVDSIIKHSVVVGVLFFFKKKKRFWENNLYSIFLAS